MEPLQVTFDLMFREKFTAEFLLRGGEKTKTSPLCDRSFTPIHAHAHVHREAGPSWSGCQQCLPSQLPPSCFFLLAFLLVFLHRHRLPCSGRYRYHQPVTLSKTFSYATSPDGSKWDRDSALVHEVPVSSSGWLLFYYFPLFRSIDIYLKRVIIVCISIHVVIHLWSYRLRCWRWISIRLCLESEAKGAIWTATERETASIYLLCSSPPATVNPRITASVSWDPPVQNP